jgi:NAD(P)-dependent dehydrogenase (short-subunit alcohol dehydrogenase family)
MGALDGRIAIVTGAGRGLGREYALRLAAEGATVVVNDVGAAEDGSTSTANADPGAAATVVAEIEEHGGRALANADDVSTWAGAESLVVSTVDALGGVDVLVNNAGILRDRLIVNMTEDEWDDVVRVHLKGHFAPTRFAAAFWRAEHKADRGRPRRIVNTSSTSGLMANPGQSNYGAAKSGIATFTQIAAKELARYDVRCNCIAPAARTRLTMASPGLHDIMAPSDGRFDEWDPANIAPLVVYLASERCRFNGELFYAQGGTVQRVRSWDLDGIVRTDGPWDVAGLADALDQL